MTLMKNTIKNISGAFSVFEKELGFDRDGRVAANYQVMIDCFVFKYFGQPQITNEILQDILTEKKIEATFREISIKDIRKKLGYCFSYANHMTSKFSEVELRKICLENNSEYTGAVDSFFSILDRHIRHPYEKIFTIEFSHSADLLSDFMMWYACFIILSKGKGILIIAGASD